VRGWFGFILEQKTPQFHASRLRQGQRSLIVLDKVDAGSQYVTLKLLFDDGVIRIVRIPFPRCPKNEQYVSCVGGFIDYKEKALAMESEIATLRYIWGVTSVYVPKVFGYNQN
jgi:hypothetical protein